MNVPLDVASLHDPGLTFVVGPRWHFDRLPRDVLVLDSCRIRAVLGNFKCDALAMLRLRKLLSEDPTSGIACNRLNDHAIVERMAGLVERGTCCLAEITPVAQNTVSALHGMLQRVHPADESAIQATCRIAAKDGARVTAAPPSKIQLPSTTKATSPVPGTAAVTASEKPFSQWSIDERFTEALKRTGPKLPAQFRSAFAELLTPEVAATIVGTLALIATAHLIGGVFAAAFDVLLIGVGFAFLGWTAFEAGQQLGKFIYLTVTATDAASLDYAAEALAKVVVLIGVEALLVLLTKAASKASPKAGAKPGGSGKNASNALEPKKPQQQRPASNAGKSEAEVRAKPKNRAELATIDREQIAKLVQQGRIDEARDVLRPLLKNRDLQGVIDRLEVSSQPGKAVFWSGDKAAGEAFANKIGGVTLETTPGGRAVDGWNEIQSAFPGWKGEPPPNGFDFWTTLSKKFADGASGDVNVIQTAEKARIGGGDVWRSVEKGILETLQENSIVDKILFHTI